MLKWHPLGWIEIALYVTEVRPFPESFIPEIGAEYLILRPNVFQPHVRGVSRAVSHLLPRNAWFARTIYIRFVFLLECRFLELISLSVKIMCMMLFQKIDHRNDAGMLIVFSAVSRLIKIWRVSCSHYQLIEYFLDCELDFHSLPIPCRDAHLPVQGLKSAQSLFRTSSRLRLMKKRDLLNWGEEIVPIVRELKAWSLTPLSGK